VHLLQRTKQLAYHARARSGSIELQEVWDQALEITHPVLLLPLLGQLEGGRTTFRRKA